MELELDYSEFKPVVNVTVTEEWEPPIHKFFGKKLPNGKMEKEPVYVHQEYPRAMYKLIDGKIKAKIVGSEMEKDALGEGWEKNPSAFGYIGAPSFEQRIAMEAKKAAELLEKQDDAKDMANAIVDTLQAAPKRVGRPAKV